MLFLQATRIIITSTHKHILTMDRLQCAVLGVVMLLLPEHMPILLNHLSVDQVVLPLQLLLECVDMDVTDIPLRIDPVLL